MTQWKRIWLAVLLCVTPVAHSAPGEPLLAISEVEEVLSGNGTSNVYIRIFGGIVPLPNTYVFDSGLRAGARFRRDGGRVLVGSYLELSDAFLNHVSLNATAEDQICGLHVIHWTNGQEEELQLIHNGIMYLLFADRDPRVWKAALHMHCMSKWRRFGEPDAATELADVLPY